MQCAASVRDMDGMQTSFRDRLTLQVTMEQKTSSHVRSLNRDLHVDLFSNKSKKHEIGNFFLFRNSLFFFQKRKKREKESQKNRANIYGLLSSGSGNFRQKATACFLS